VIPLRSAFSKLRPMKPHLSLNENCSELKAHALIGGRKVREGFKVGKYDAQTSPCRTGGQELKKLSRIAELVPATPNVPAFHQEAITPTHPTSPTPTTPANTKGGAKVLTAGGKPVNVFVENTSCLVVYRAVRAS